MNKQVYKFYFDQFRGMKRSIFLSIMGSLIQFIPYYFIFRLIRRSFDIYIPSKNLPALTGAVVIIIILFLVKSGVMLCVRYLTLQINKSFIANLRYKIVEKIQAISYLKMVYIDTIKYHILTVQHSEKIYFLNSSLINQAIPALIASIIFLVFLGSINFSMTLFLFFILIPLFFVTKIFLFKLSGQIKEVTRNFKTFNKRTIFMLRALDLTKTLSGETFEINKQRNNIDTLNLAEVKLSLLRIIVTLIQDLIFSFFGISILLVGGYSVIKGEMTLGAMLSYYAAVLIFKNYLQTFFVTLPQIEEGKESLIELCDFFETEVGVNYSGTKKIEHLEKISMQNIQFMYQDELILKSIDLEIIPGKTVVISGPNGGGKTTLLNLIIGLIRPTGGVVCANGIPYDEIDLKKIRRSLGILRQVPFIFKGTVEENISYGREDVSLDELKEAATIAGALAFIEKLPKGFATIIGENGMTLSGGQNQKIALARALLRKPRFLFLDEPTNHLDVTSIMSFIENLKKNYSPLPACLILSHEQAIIEKADIHYILQKGKFDLVK